MPTFDTTNQFEADLRRLKAEERRSFEAAVQKFVQDLKRGAGLEFRASLRIRPMKGTHGIYEMTWAGNDGRATFEFGPPRREGERHVIWRRVGGHDVFSRP